MPALVPLQAWFRALTAQQLVPGLPPMQPELLDKHYLRKHGKDAYYGQGH